MLIGPFDQYEEKSHICQLYDLHIQGTVRLWNSLVVASDNFNDCSNSADIKADNSGCVMFVSRFLGLINKYRMKRSNFSLLRIRWNVSTQGSFI